MCRRSIVMAATVEASGRQRQVPLDATLENPEPSDDEFTGRVEQQRRGRSTFGERLTRRLRGWSPSRTPARGTGGSPPKGWTSWTDQRSWG